MVLRSLNPVWRFMWQWVLLYDRPALETESLLSLCIPKSVISHGLARGLLFEIDLLWEPIKKDQSHVSEPENSLPQCPVGKWTQETAMKRSRVISRRDKKTIRKQRSWWSATWMKISSRKLRFGAGDQTEILEMSSDLQWVMCSH